MRNLFIAAKNSTDYGANCKKMLILIFCSFFFIIFWNLNGFTELIIYRIIDYWSKSYRSVLKCFYKSKKLHEKFFVKINKNDSGKYFLTIKQYSFHYITRQLLMKNFSVTYIIMSFMLCGLKYLVKYSSSIN